MEKDEFIKSIDFDKGGGLVPVVVQDERTRDILMLAYANEEALRLTFETGMAHYWSRSRSSLWKKGESSGHVQKIKKITADCDRDTVLYIVDQVGVACHTGAWSCFDSASESHENVK